MIALRNLWRARLRSVITLFGIGVGVALFLAITAISNDLKSQIDDAMSAYSLDIVVSERRATSPFSSRIPATQIKVLHQQYGDAVVPMVMGTRNEPWNSYALLIGASNAFVRRIPLLEGRMYVEGAHEIMLGEIGAQRMRLGVGQSLPLDGDSYRIVGIFRTGSRLFDGGVLTDVPMAQKLLTRAGQEPHFTLALVQTADRAQKDRIIAAFSDRDSDLKAIPATEFAGSLRLLRVVDAFIATLSVVAVAGVFLVIVNTLVMAVNERTREIGILMAIGWSPGRVLRLFLFEGSVLMTIGLLVGWVMAMGMLRMLNGIESIGYGWIPLQIPLGLVAQAGLLCLAVMLSSLIWPALVILRLHPIEAIRNE
jgi:putative ABC transport system permease protein